MTKNVDNEHLAVNAHKYIGRALRAKPSSMHIAPRLLGPASRETPQWLANRSSARPAKQNNSNTHPVHNVAEVT